MRPQRQRQRPARSTPNRTDAPIAVSRGPGHPGGDGAPAGPDPLRDDARARACDAIAEQCARHPDLAPMTPDESGLDPRDGALAHSIYDAVIRRRVTLKPLISAHLRQRFDDIEPALQAALLAGAAQLLLMDRLPAHAVLDRTVEWAKVRLRPGAGNLVNAVLRRVAEMRHPDPERAHRERWTNRTDELPLADGRALVIPDGMMPPDEHGRIAIAHGIPKRLYARWCDQFGHDDAEHLAAHSILRPPTVLNVSAWRRAHPSEPLPQGVEPHELQHAGVWTGPREDLRTLLRDQPLLWAQDGAAAEPLGLLASDPPAVLHDLCAGRGTKTAQALATFPDTRIIASDTNPDRLRDLRHRFGGNARVSVADHTRATAMPVDPGDAVLLDVPCSNTGVLARRVEARHRATKPVLARMVETQRAITAQAAERMPPGARLLYATCSVDVSENDDHADWACSALGLRYLDQHRRLPAGSPSAGAAAYTDGSYAVLLRKH